MKAAPALVFLLLHDEPDGPYASFDVAEMLNGEEIVPETLASIEGMRAWRSVKEVLVWSNAVLLESIRPEAEAMISRIASHQLEKRECRMELRKLFSLDVNFDALATVLEVNGLLQRRHREYCNGDQGWNPAVLEPFPAMELYDLGKQQFPRDWSADWINAGGKLFDGRMIARKDDPVWLEMSDFKLPASPFSMDANLWTKEIPYNEAERLGIVTLQTVIQPPEIDPEFKPIFKP